MSSTRRWRFIGLTRHIPLSLLSSTQLIMLNFCIVLNLIPNICLGMRWLDIIFAKIVLSLRTCLNFVKYMLEEL
uniref:Uncharacterized protein MANES_04G007000 n=2 Tax=Rhizophora mucronata TaxID=61149 RepID=A0A2P2KZH7_RHIMU